MLSDIDIDNVYVYISDATRLDFTPVEVLNRGVSFRTIASGIHSPTSIASLVSGTFLPQHKVGDFSDVLPNDVPCLLDAEGVDTGFANTMNDVRFDPGGSADIIANTLDIESGPPELLDEIESPFIFVERGPGGHAPYVAKKEYDTAQNYMRDRGAASRGRYGQEYRIAVKEDTKWFLSRLEALERRGDLEDTLVIYTSDHGEMLGEAGMQSHSPPIHPRLVYVPTVFIHPEMSTGESIDGVLRHVDILPTISSLLSLSWSGKVEPAGRDLITESTAEYGYSFYDNNKQTPLGDTNIRFDSVWDRTGGYVFPRIGLIKRSVMAIHHMLRAHWREYARRHWKAHLSFKLRGVRCHWSPTFEESDGRRLVERVHNLDRTSGVDVSNEVATERLRELGYI